MNGWILLEFAFDIILIRSFSRLLFIGKRMSFNFLLHLFNFTFQIIIFKAISLILSGDVNDTGAFTFAGNARLPFSLFKLNDSFVSATEQQPHLFNEESIHAIRDGERYHLL